MLVSEAITLLRESELKQLSLKTNDTTILGYLNFGILELHKRFKLWEAEAVITQATDTFLYTLDGIDTNVSIDLSTSDLIVIESVFDPDSLEYKVNSRKDYLPYKATAPVGYVYPVAIQKFNTVKIIKPVVGDKMTAIYRAAPKFLTAVTAEIPLPQQFLEALFLYVGYKGQGSVKSGLKDESNTHFIRFDASCKRIHLEGLHQTDDLVSTKFYSRGYV